MAEPERRQAARVPLLVEVEALALFEAMGDVVRAVPGESTGIRFTALQERHRKTLAVLVEHLTQTR